MTTAESQLTPIVDGKLIGGRPLPGFVTRLKIPPAWTDVRVSLDSGADLLAIGYDDKGRRQYLYSDRFIEAQKRAKFERVRKLIDAEAKIVAKMLSDTRSADYRKRELAAIAHLIYATGIRPGSDKATQADVQAYGATTLEARHVIDSPNEPDRLPNLRLRFVGKKGVPLDIPVRDPFACGNLRLRMLQIFQKQGIREGNAQYWENGGCLPGNTTRLWRISPRELLEYVGGLYPGLLVKDLRTLKANVIASKFIASYGYCKFFSPKALKEAKQNVAEHVAYALGNTAAVALKSYIDPTLFEQWESRTDGLWEFL